MALDTLSDQVFLAESSPSTGPESGGGSSTWSTALTSIFGTGGSTCTLTLAQSTGLTVAPAKMIIEAFNVDNSRVLTTLKIQLLSGEMRRASRLN